MAARIDTRPIVLAGTALWFAGFLVLLPFYGALARSGHRVWLWTCLAGSLLGVAGWLLMRRHRAEGRQV